MSVKKSTYRGSHKDMPSWAGRGGGYEPYRYDGPQDEYEWSRTNQRGEEWVEQPYAHPYYRQDAYPASWGPPDTVHPSSYPEPASSEMPTSNAQWGPRKQQWIPPTDAESSRPNRAPPGADADRAWEPASSWKSSHTNGDERDGHFERGRYERSGQHKSSGKTRSKHKKNDGHRDQDDMWNNWERRTDNDSERAPGSRNNRYKPQPFRPPHPGQYERDQSPESYQSYGRSRSPPYKRQRHESPPYSYDRSPASYKHDSARGRSVSRSVSERSHTRSRSPGSASPGQRPTIHRLPSASQTYIPPSHNDQGKSKKKKNKKKNGNTSDMPPPFKIPTKPPSTYAEPMQMTFDHDDGGSRQFVPKKGFKPIGEPSNSLKKFFPGDEDDDRMDTGPSSAPSMYPNRANGKASYPEKPHIPLPEKPAWVSRPDPPAQATPPPTWHPPARPSIPTPQQPPASLPPPAQQPGNNYWGPPPPQQQQQYGPPPSSWPPTPAPAPPKQSMASIYDHEQAVIDRIEAQERERERQKQQQHGAPAYQPQAPAYQPPQQPAQAFPQQQPAQTYSQQQAAYSAQQHGTGYPPAPAPYPQQPGYPPQHHPPSAYPQPQPTPGYHPQQPHLPGYGQHQPVPPYAHQHHPQPTPPYAPPPPQQPPMYGQHPQFVPSSTSTPTLPTPYPHFVAAHHSSSSTPTPQIPPGQYPTFVPAQHPIPASTQHGISPPVPQATPISQGISTPAAVSTPTLPQHVPAPTPPPVQHGIAIPHSTPPAEPEPAKPQPAQQPVVEASPMDMEIDDDEPLPPSATNSTLVSNGTPAKFTKKKHRDKDIGIYTVVNQVGEGTFGKVYKALNTTTGVHIALKLIRMEQEKDGFPVTAMREVKLLQSLNQENVIRLYEMLVHCGSVYMVFEYMDHDLTGILSQNQFTFTEAHLKSLCHQMFSGLAYLHHKGIIHRDIKGSNILLNNRGELKLADFGLARFYQKRRRADYTNRVITLWYRPPELLYGATIYGPEVDMWSAGCIMLELYTKKAVFTGNDELHQLDTIYRIIGTPDSHRWPDIGNLPWYELVKPREPHPNRFREMFTKWMSPPALDLAELLLCYDPTKRISAAEALQAPYFTTEEPQAERPVMLNSNLEGEWHEMESKRERAKKRKK